MCTFLFCFSPVPNRNLNSSTKHLGKISNQLEYISLEKSAVHNEVYDNTGKTSSSWVHFCILRYFFIFPYLFLWTCQDILLSDKGKKWDRLLMNSLHSRLVVKIEQEKSKDQIFLLSWIILDPDDSMRNSCDAIKSNYSSFWQ